MSQVERSRDAIPWRYRIATDRTAATESNRDRECRNGRWCNGPAGTG